MGTLLEVKGLTKEFGKFRALDDVDLAIEEGELVALIGPNGAGKTTFYNVVTGGLPPSSGTVFFKGEDITGLPSYMLTHKGLARSFQVTNIFSGLTVLENFRVAILAYTGKSWNLLSHIDRDQDLYDEALRILELVGLEGQKDLPCDALSHGDRRRVDIGLALATKPDLLLLDEPTAGMNPEETEKMVKLINALAEQMVTTFVLTEHDMDVIFSISERIIVMHQGRVLADDQPREIRDDTTVQEAYLGGLT